MPMLVVVRQQDRSVVIHSAEEKLRSTPEIRKLQTIGFQTLNAALKRVGEPHFHELLRLTFQHLLAEDWAEFDDALAKLPAPFAYIEMASQIVDCLDDTFPCAILCAMNSIMSAARQIELRKAGGATKFVVAL